jgi:hypothetical protein
MSNEINLRIVLENTVNGTVYGLQKGKGSNYETIQAQPGNGKDLFFDFSVPVKENNISGFSLSGPFVQGTAESRFVYIGIGSYAGQAGAPWNGRLKVPLPEATLLTSQGDTGDYRLCCTVPGRTKDGKPMFATVKPFGGWFMQKLSA